MNQAMQVLTSRKTVEWYTPPFLIERARDVMGRIDLDPASNHLPQTWILADTYFTEGGLEVPWYGRIWLNPPFDQTPKWVAKLRREWESGNTEEAILLVNANLGYKWFEELWRAFPCCFLRERVRFIREDGTQGGQAKRGQVLLHLPPQNGHLAPHRFYRIFRDLGRIIQPNEPARRGGGHPPSPSQHFLASPFP